MTFSRIPFAAALVGALLATAAPSVFAQNIVNSSDGVARERQVIGDAEVQLLDTAPGVPKIPLQATDVFERLALRVDELLQGWPWRPFYHQLGISGAEVHFGHPDELFHVLSLALPCLDVPRGAKVKAFLADRLRETPPFQIEGFAPKQGQPRERYTVPEQLRPTRATEARDAWGVYAFLEYVLASGDEAAVVGQWPAIRQRIGPLLEEDYEFDPASQSYRHDEAQRLNGDLAGLYAAIHLARMAKDEETAKVAKARAAALLQLRLDLERINARILQPTDVATKSLHHFKLARYLHLPEPALVMLRHDGTAAERVRPFREARPGWWMAFGDRLIGGENYTTSPDFGRALFGAATDLEPPAPQQMHAWLDVPWCKGDLYQIERLALLIRATAGK